LKSEFYYFFSLKPDSTVFPPNCHSNSRFGVTKSLWESRSRSTLADLRGRVIASVQKKLPIPQKVEGVWYYGIVEGEMELISTRHLFIKNYRVAKSRRNLILRLQFSSDDLWSIPLCPHIESTFADLFSQPTGNVPLGSFYSVAFCFHSSLNKYSVTLTK
jgi:hypothetical protein